MLTFECPCSSLFHIGTRCFPADQHTVKQSNSVVPLHPPTPTPARPHCHPAGLRAVRPRRQATSWRSDQQAPGPAGAAADVRGASGRPVQTRSRWAGPCGGGGGVRASRVLRARARRRPVCRQQGKCWETHTLVSPSSLSLFLKFFSQDYFYIFFWFSFQVLQFFFLLSCGQSTALTISWADKHCQFSI